MDSINIVGSSFLKQIPPLFHFSGGSANFSLSAVAVVLSQGVLCFLFWKVQAAPIITESQRHSDQNAEVNIIKSNFYYRLYRWVYVTVPLAGCW